MEGNRLSETPSSLYFKSLEIKNNLTLSDLIKLLNELVDLILARQKDQDVSAVQFLSHMDAQGCHNCLCDIVFARSLKVEYLYRVLSTLNLNDLSLKALGGFMEKLKKHIGIQSGAGYHNLQIVFELPSLDSDLF